MDILKNKIKERSLPKNIRDSLEIIFYIISVVNTVNGKVVNNELQNLLKEVKNAVDKASDDLIEKLWKDLVLILLKFNILQ
jgi:hypothetical protein